jgi:hypothetical protein
LHQKSKKLGYINCTKRMFYCGPLSRAIFRLLFRRGEKQ